VSPEWQAVAILCWRAFAYSVTVTVLTCAVIGYQDWRANR
jgi:hypothetical protein